MTNKDKDPKKSHLDDLLEDKSDEFRASVLQFAIDSGLKPNDPAFRLVKYIGYLAQITEEAPQEWKQLFKELKKELNQWSQTTAQHLKTSTDHSQEIRHLATNCDRLSTTLNVLDLTCRQQLQQMEILAELLMKSNKDGQENESTLKEKLNQFEKNQELITHAILNINKQIENLQKFQNPIKKISNALAGDWDVKQWINSFLFGFFLWVMAALWIGSIFFIFPPMPRNTAQMIQNIDKHTNYNYTKLTRIEKGLGTDPHQKKR